MTISQSWEDAMTDEYLLGRFVSCCDAAALWSVGASSWANSDFYGQSGA